MGFRIVLQKDTNQCGVASLAMVCRHYGAVYSDSFLNSLCHATTEGVSMKGMADTAQKLGLDTLCCKLSVDKLQDYPLPAILYWGQNHFVVLYRINKKRERFYIADPARGRVSYSKEEFTDQWCGHGGENGSGQGIAMFLEPTEDFGQIKDETPTDKESFKFLAGYISRYRKYFLHIFLGLAVGCILQLVMPFLTQAIVDIGIRHSDISFIWLVLFGELMIVTGRTATEFVRHWLLLHISMRVNISLVSDFLIKLLRLPMSFFDTKVMGDLLQRMGDHTRVQDFLTGQVLNIIFTLLSFIIFGVVLLMYSDTIFIVFVLGSILYLLWTVAFLKKRKLLDYELFGRQVRNQNCTYQFLSSTQEIKLQDCEKRRRWEWEDTQADFFVTQMKSMKLRQKQEAGSIFINEVKNIVITVFAASAVINGQMSLGAMLAVQYIIGQLNSPVEQIMSFIYSLQDVRISLERIADIHHTGEEDCGENMREGFEHDLGITISNIDFKYDPHSSKKTIDGVSFDIRPGKVTAIVGASGSGKTTMIKLMLGYYPLLRGQISISGKDLRDYRLKWWRRQCGVVMQDGFIFSDTIARNIAVADGEVDSERLGRAARIANIHDWIMSLPLGYETKIGRDGVGISQGQKQRILIARAVYRDPDFIFLDEATNSLDAQNERVIVENLSSFYKNRTVVVVAHRLSTVRDADTIVVLDKGRVVEIGNHEELIGRQGAYFNLVRNQLELGN